MRRINNGTHNYSMKTKTEWRIVTVCVQPKLLADIDRERRVLGVSRSEFFRRLAIAWLKYQDEAGEDDE
jgi:hypothetical protein